MAQFLIVEIGDRGEGSPDHPEEGAQPALLQATPAVFSQKEQVNNPAETGTVSAINVESKENDDSNDAAFTKEETAPEKKNNVNTDKIPTVLIIEDTAELAEIIQATLERMNMVTAHETHGNRAIEKFKTMSPDVILLDIGLPDMTGWKIIEAIKEHTLLGNKIPLIIVITAYDDPANRLVGKLQGVYSYLIKPFTSDEIEKAVTQAINSATS